MLSRVDDGRLMSWWWFC